MTLDVARQHQAQALLQGKLGIAVSSHPNALERVARDFGGLIHCPPAMLVVPRDEEDVLFTLDVARQCGVPVITRGAGHSQSGQCLAAGAIALDMSAISGVLQIDPEGLFVEARGGTLWREVFDRAFDEGFRPVGPTYMLDATMAGTLSVAGVGAESFCTGAQINNVMQLDVATLDGRIMTCSVHKNRDLFDVVRAGLGQFGVILRVRYPLRRATPNLRCRTLAYRDAKSLVAAVHRVIRDNLASFVSGFLLSNPADGNPFILVLGEEIDETMGASSALDELRGTRVAAPEVVPTWLGAGRPAHPFFRSYDARDRTREAGSVHPWLELLYPNEQAVPALEHTLANAPIELAPGSNVIIPVARHGAPAPCFPVPAGVNAIWGIGLAPSLTREQGVAALERMRPFRQGASQLGSTRYLSGFLEFSKHACDSASSSWATQMGAAWPTFQAAKRRWDPDHLLNPGMIRY